MTNITSEKSKKKAELAINVIKNELIKDLVQELHLPINYEYFLVEKFWKLQAWKSYTSKQLAKFVHSYIAKEFDTHCFNFQYKKITKDAMQNEVEMHRGFLEGLIFYLRKHPEYLLKPAKDFKIIQYLERFYPASFEEVIDGNNKPEDKIIQADLNVDSDSLRVNYLKLNLKKATLQFKKNPPIDIEPKSKPIILLNLLMSKPDNIISYTEIAKEAELNCYRNGIDNASVSQDVNYVKRDLSNILISAGMAREEVKKYIIPYKGQGYKFAAIKSKKDIQEVNKESITQQEINEESITQ